jgi:hypothetical protein
VSFILAICSVHRSLLDIIFLIELNLYSVVQRGLQRRNYSIRLANNLNTNFIISWQMRSFLKWPVTCNPSSLVSIKLNSRVSTPLQQPVRTQHAGSMQFTHTTTTSGAIQACTRRSTRVSTPLTWQRTQLVVNRFTVIQRVVGPVHWQQWSWLSAIGPMSSRLLCNMIFVPIF